MRCASADGTSSTSSFDRTCSSAALDRERIDRVEREQTAASSSAWRTSRRFDLGRGVLGGHRRVGRLPWWRLRRRHRRHRLRCRVGVGLSSACSTRSRSRAASNTAAANGSLAARASSSACAASPAARDTPGRGAGAPRARRSCCAAKSCWARSCAAQRMPRAGLGGLTRRDQFFELPSQRVEARDCRGPSPPYRCVAALVEASRLVAEREPGPLGFGLGASKSRGDGLAPAVEIVARQHAGLERAWQLRRHSRRDRDRNLGVAGRAAQRVFGQIEEHTVRFDDAFGRGLACGECTHRAHDVSRAGRRRGRGRTVT